MTDWENIISFESLYKAHRRARLSKRHKKEVILFEANLSENLWSLHYDLKYGRYKVGGYHKFTIYDPKEREIQAISYRDRIVQHSLCDNYLSPLLERHLIYDNSACRVGKGTSFAISRLRKFMLAHYKRYGKSGYIVKLDVRKYFPSIDHELAKQKLGKIVKDTNIFGLLCEILDSYNPDTGKGLPMGNQTSQCIALLYLDILDRMFKERLGVKHYIRYMDDIVAVVPDKKTAKLCFDVAGDVLIKNRLILNPKSDIFPLKNGVAFLGWNFFMSDDGEIVQKLRRAVKKRVMCKVKNIGFLVSIKKLSARKREFSLISYGGLFRKGDAFYFFCKVQDMFCKCA